MSNEESTSASSKVFFNAPTLHFISS